MRHITKYGPWLAAAIALVIIGYGVRTVLGYRPPSEFSMATGPEGGAYHAFGLEYQRRLAERHITLELTDAAREHLVRTGYEPDFGARPLKRAIQREVETPLAKAILEGQIRDGMHLRAGVTDGRLTFEPAHEGLGVAGKA